MRASCWLACALCVPFASAAGAERAAKSEGQKQEPKDEKDLDEEMPQYQTTVQAARPASSATQRSIRGEEIMTRARSTPYDFLRLVPNMIIGLHEGGGKAPQYLLRGFDADHGADLALYFDGIPVNLVSHVHGLGYLDPHFIIPEVVERLDVQKGPFDAENGSFATAGTLRLTARSFLPKSEVGYTFGSFESHRALGILSPDLGPAKGLFALEGYRTNGFTAAGQNRRYNFFTKIRLPAGAGSRLDLLGIAYGADWNAPGLLPDAEIAAGRSPFGAFNPTDGGSSQRNIVALTFERAARRGTFRAQLYYQQYRLTLYHDFTGFAEDPVHGDQILQQESRNVVGGELSYAFPLRAGSVRFDTKLGGQWRTDAVTAELWRTTRRERRARVYEAGITQTGASVYAKERVSFGRRVTLDLGVRGDLVFYDVTDPHEDTRTLSTRTSATASAAIVNPKANLVLKPLEHLHVFGNFGTGFRTPDARAAVLPAFGGIGRTIAAEGGVRAWLADRRLELAAVGWWMDTEHEVVFVADAGANEELGPARRFGGELEVRARILPWLWADFDLSYTRARFLDSDGFVPRAPRLLVAGGLQARHPAGWFGSLRARHVGSFPLTEDGSRESRAYTVVDLVAGWETKRVQVSLNVQNLFNTAWRDSEYFYELRTSPERPVAGDVVFRPGEPFLVLGNVKLFF